MHTDADRIIDLYERHAAAYIADRGHEITVEGGWLARFAGLVRAGGDVLDIGCGSGEPIARHLIEHGFAITGVDASKALIARCRARFPEAIWHVADMRALALGQTFDGLLAWDSLFHLTYDDQRRMFDVFARHAADGAILMFTSGPAHGESIGSYRGEPLYHASLAPDEYRALLAAHGFTVVAGVLDDQACGGHSVWLARHRTAV
jgi:SAM-dependent methyltransferase